MELKVIKEGVSIPLEVPDEMRTASDAKILSFVEESYNMPIEGLVVERNVEGILVHPPAVYG